MKYSVFFSDDAVADLGGIADFIALDNPARALAFIDELQNRTVDTLAIVPKGGRIYKNQTRFLPLSGYIVLYEIEDAKSLVNVLHIVNGRTDWKKR